MGQQKERVVCNTSTNRTVQTTVNFRLLIFGCKFLSCFRDRENLSKNILEKDFFYFRHFFSKLVFMSELKNHPREGGDFFLQLSYLNRNKIENIIPLRPTRRWTDALFCRFLTVLEYSPIGEKIPPTTAPRTLYTVQKKIF